MGVVAGTVEEDPLVRDLGGRAEIAATVRERDALNVLDVFQQRFEVLSDLHPFVTGEVAGLGPIMGVSHRGSPSERNAPTRRAPSTAAEGTGRLLLFSPYWGMLGVEPLLDELLDLPSGNIKLTGDRCQDHRDVAILPGGGELHGTGLVSRRRGGENAGHFVGGIDVQVHFGLAHRLVLRSL